MTLDLQQSDGRFVTQATEASTHLHPHSYTLEGLLDYGRAYQDKKVLELVKKGIQWALNHQLKDGGIFCFYAGQQFLPYVRVDVLAQTLRLAAIFSQYDSPFRSENQKKLELLRQKLLTSQVISGAQEGGFFYGQEENGLIHYHVNAWVTMFASQALWLYDDLQSNAPAYTFDFFV